MTSLSIVAHTWTLLCIAGHLNTLASPVEDTVSKEGEHDEVDGRPHAVLDSALRANPVVHHLVPVLTCQNLQRQMETACMNMLNVIFKKSPGLHLQTRCIIQNLFTQILWVPE